MQNFVYMKDFYKSLKPKETEAFNIKTYFDIMFNTLNSMFEWEGLPDSIPARFLEGYLHAFGHVSVGKINGKLYCGQGGLTGDVDAYGEGTEVLLTTPIGSTRGARSVDMVYGRNNDSATPDSILWLTVHYLSEIAISLDCNITYARLLPIPVVNDDKTKVAIEQTVEALKAGKFGAVLSGNILDVIEGDLKLVNLSDVKNVDRIPYLSRLFDDVLKQFYNFYGQNLQTINQGSQTNEDELHGMDSTSRILTDNMLKCRKELSEELNRIFGLQTSVHYSKAWENEIKSTDARAKILEKEAENLEDLNESEDQEGESDGNDGTD